MNLLTFDIPWLLCLILTPLLCAVFMGTGLVKKQCYVKAFSLLGISATVAVIGCVVFCFDRQDSMWQLEGYYKLGNFFGLHLGVDGLSLSMITLTVLISSLSIIWCLFVGDGLVSRYRLTMLFMLEALVLAAFLSLDILFLYIFFEAALIPLFLMIGIWGGEDRVAAAFKIFLYTVAGSLFMLSAIGYMYIVYGVGDFDNFYFMIETISAKEKMLICLSFLVAFLLKLPIFPLHVWLPDAHVQAPTELSAVLAGVLLKLGGYGLLRFVTPMLCVVDNFVFWFMAILAVISMIYASLAAWRQDDIKKIIAYSSVAHMSFVVIAAAAASKGIGLGVQGAIMQMFSHGVVSAALFFCIGILYRRTDTRDLNVYGGLASKIPIYSFFFILFMMSAVGLPGLSGFVGEFLILVSGFRFSMVVAVFLAIGVVLSAMYMLRLYKNMFTGEIRPAMRFIKDLDCAESFILAVLAIVTIVLGIYPSILWNYTDSYMESVLNLLTRSR